MNNKETKLLNVEFHKAISGCLEYKITIGEQVFEDSFSDVFDPILDLKSWLEAISVGVEQTSFSYDNEGQEFKFDFQRVTWDKEIFVISELYAPKHFFMNAKNTNPKNGNPLTTEQNFQNFNLILLKNLLNIEIKKNKKNKLEVRKRVVKTHNS